MYFLYSVTRTVPIIVTKLLLYINHILYFYYDEKCKFIAFGDVCDRKGRTSALADEIDISPLRKMKKYGIL